MANVKKPTAWSRKNEKQNTEKPVICGERRNRELQRETLGGELEKTDTRLEFGIGASTESQLNMFVTVE